MELTDTPAAVKVVWLIIPATAQVYVYTGNTSAKICEGDTSCSAVPAYPDFSLPAKSMFD
jgi:hypothetical protein